MQSSVPSTQVQTKEGLRTIITIDGVSFCFDNGTWLPLTNNRIKNKEIPNGNKISPASADKDTFPTAVRTDELVTMFGNYNAMIWSAAIGGGIWEDEKYEALSTQADVTEKITNLREQRSHKLHAIRAIKYTSSKSRDVIDLTINTQPSRLSILKNAIVETINNIKQLINDHPIITTIVISVIVVSVICIIVASGGFGAFAAAALSGVILGAAKTTTGVIASIGISTAAAEIVGTVTVSLAIPTGGALLGAFLGFVGWIGSKIKSCFCQEPDEESVQPKPEISTENAKGGSEPPNPKSENQTPAKTAIDISAKSASNEPTTTSLHGKQKPKPKPTAPKNPTQDEHLTPPKSVATATSNTPIPSPLPPSTTADIKPSTTSAQSSTTYIITTTKGKNVTVETTGALLPTQAKTTQTQVTSATENREPPVSQLLGAQQFLNTELGKALRKEPHSMWLENNQNEREAARKKAAITSGSNTTIKFSPNKED